MPAPSFGGGGGGGSTAPLGQTNNIFGKTSGDRDFSAIVIGDDLVEAIATRTAYADATAGWEDSYRDTRLNTALYYTSAGEPTVQYQILVGTEWVNNGDPVVGIKGAQGSDAADFRYDSASARAAFFSFQDNRDLLKENETSARTTLNPSTLELAIWTGVSAPSAAQYDDDFWQPQSLVVGLNSINFEADNAVLSMALESLHLTNTFKETGYLIQQKYTDAAGMSKPMRLNAGPAQDFPLGDVFDTELTGPQSLLTEGTVGSAALSFTVRTGATGGTLRVEAFTVPVDDADPNRDPTVNDPRAVNNSFTAPANTLLTIIIPNPSLSTPGIKLLTRYSGVNLMGVYRTLAHLQVKRLYG